MFTSLFSTFSIRLLFAGVSSFLIAIFIGPQVIENLKLRQIGQKIREEGVEAHKLKAGIPTMGGIIILVPAFLTTIFWIKPNFFVLIVWFCIFGMGILGFLDDATKVLKARSLGLTPWQKIAGQALVALTVGAFLMRSSGANFSVFSKVPGSPGIVKVAPTMVQMPFFSPVDFSWGYLFFIIFVIVAFTNAVNLTDGLDGLAGGVASLALFPYLLIAIVCGNQLLAQKADVIFAPGTEELAILCISIICGCLGFLWFNSHPAQVFMGDTGSMALGGAFGALAVCTKTEFFLVIIGGVFVVEALSVVLQVWYFKTTGGKRIFRMSPIHHHFELCDWPEEKIVARFLIVQFFLSVAGTLLFLQNVS